MAKARDLQAMIDERRPPLPPFETEAELATWVLDEHGQHRLWSQRRGVLDARRWSLRPAPAAGDGAYFGYAAHEHQRATAENQSENHERPCMQGLSAEPSAGLEPATPSLPWKCSTN